METAARSTIPTPPRGQGRDIPGDFGWPLFVNAPYSRPLYRSTERYGHQLGQAMSNGRPTKSPLGPVPPPPPFKFTPMKSPPPTRSPPALPSGTSSFRFPGLKISNSTSQSPSLPLLSPYPAASAPFEPSRPPHPPLPSPAITLSRPPLPLLPALAPSSAPFPTLPTRSAPPVPTRLPSSPISPTPYVPPRVPVGRGCKNSSENTIQWGSPPPYSPHRGYTSPTSTLKLSSNNPYRNCQNFSRPRNSSPKSKHCGSPSHCSGRTSYGRSTDSGYYSTGPPSELEWFHHALLPRQYDGNTQLLQFKDSLSGAGILHENDRGSWLVRGCSWMFQGASSSDNIPTEGTHGFDHSQDSQSRTDVTGYRCTECREMIFGGFFSMSLNMFSRFKLCRTCFGNQLPSQEQKPTTDDSYGDWLFRQKRDENITLAAGHAAYGRRAGIRSWATDSTTIESSDDPVPDFALPTPEASALTDSSLARPGAADPNAADATHAAAIITKEEAVRSDSPTVEAALSPSTRACAICADELPSDQFSTSRMTSRCIHEHSACLGCTQQWIDTQLTEAGWDRITCMECSERLEYVDVQRHATQAVFDRYDLRAMRAALGNDPDFVWCQNTACNSGQIHAGGTDMPVFECRACRSRYCLTHQVPWHEGETCAAFDRRMSDQSPVEEGIPMDEDTVRLYAGDQGSSTMKPPPCSKQNSSQDERVSRWVRSLEDASDRPSNYAPASRSATPFAKRSTPSTSRQDIDADTVTDDDVSWTSRQRTGKAKSLVRKLILKDFSGPSDSEARARALALGRSKQANADEAIARDLQRQSERGSSDDQRIEGPRKLRRRVIEQLPRSVEDRQARRDAAFTRPPSSIRGTEGLERRSAVEKRSEVLSRIKSDASAARALQRKYEKEEQTKKQKALDEKRKSRERIKSDEAAARALEEKFKKEEKARKQKEADQEREAYRKRKADEQKGEQTVKASAKACPKCHWYIQKSSGCDHMTCSKCKYEFCYLCMAEYEGIRDRGNSAHNAGCKFYR